MKVQIIGVGVVGGAQAYLATKLGHEVIGFDRKLSDFPYAKIVKNLENNPDITFVCTPETAVQDVVENLVSSKINGLYVIKSTVPPATTQNMMNKFGIHICHNPEFLIERIAYESIAHPSVVVIGECCPEHGKILKSFYSPLNCPILITNPSTSEMVKLTINSYLSTLISFWNEIDRIASKAGLKTEEVASIAKYNPRISAYGTDFFGVPFGGKCLPKDLDQLIKFFHDMNINPVLFDSIRDFNQKLNAHSL